MLVWIHHSHLHFLWYCIRWNENRNWRSYKRSQTCENLETNSWTPRYRLGVLSRSRSSFYGGIMVCMSFLQSGRNLGSTTWSCFWLVTSIFHWSWLVRLHPEQDVSELNEVTQTSRRVRASHVANWPNGVKSWNCPIVTQMKAGVVRLVVAWAVLPIPLRNCLVKLRLNHCGVS